jgi:hypothetical protein
MSGGHIPRWHFSGSGSGSLSGSLSFFRQGKRIKIFPFDLFGTLTGAYALSRRCLRFKERHAGGLAFG